MATGKDIALTTLTALERKGGYIWGQMGATWTAQKQANLEKKYNSDPEAYASYAGSAKYGKKWIGHPVWDCAGLSRWAAKQHGIAIHSGSNLIWTCDLKKKGEMAKDLELPLGAQVFVHHGNRKTHIGTYTGDGLVTEASGAQKGVVQSGVHDKKWTHWGLVKGVEYEFEPGKNGSSEKPADNEPSAGFSDRPTLRRGARGEAVREMQKLLLSAGEALPRYGADGAFGNETIAAVKSFQRKNGLAVDGICGPKTWAKLLA